MAETEVAADDTPLCDAIGCGKKSDGPPTTGEEKDTATTPVRVEYKPGAFVTEYQSLGRKALAHVFTCPLHRNFPHSEDARDYKSSPDHVKWGKEYSKRLAAITSAKAAVAAATAPAAGKGK